MSTIALLKVRARYLHGKGRDEEAWEWWREAAKRGDPGSAWTLALSLLNKGSVSKHFEEALHWASRGCPAGKEDLQLIAIQSCLRKMSCREMP